MKAKKCYAVSYTRWGYECTPYEAKSIRSAVEWIRKNGAWRYYVYILDENNRKKIVRQGWCEDW